MRVSASAERPTNQTCVALCLHSKAGRAESQFQRELNFLIGSSVAGSVSHNDQKRILRCYKEQCSLTRGKKSPASGNTALDHRLLTLSRGATPSQHQVVEETGVEREVKNAKATSNNDGVEDARCTSDI